MKYSSPYTMSTNRRTFVCFECRVTARGSFSRACPECGGDMKRVSYKARVPRKNASDKKWKRFHRMFVSNLNLRRYPFRYRKGESWGQRRMRTGLEHARKVRKADRLDV